MTFSCIIPAYNEWPRIKRVLEIVLSCPLLFEVIVVNDGSTDDTQEVIDSLDHPKLKKIHIKKNNGKLKAFFHALIQTKWEYIVMIDADYEGLTALHLQKLIIPIKDKQVDTTMMMWYESLFICKILKHDIFSWARVLPKSTFNDVQYFLEWKGFGLEARINEVIYQRKMRVRSLYFPDVHNPSKGWKQLLWKQPIDIYRSMPYWKIIRQIYYIYRQQV